MKNLSREKIKKAIDDFQNHLFMSKAEKDLKNLEKAHEEGNEKEVQKLQKKVEVWEEKFEWESWVENAAEKMASQLSFGTHISKGIHSSSRGDNINFRNKEDLGEGFIGSEVLINPELDASGNAAALPLSSFFLWPVEADGNLLIKDLIIGGSKGLRECLSIDRKKSERYFEIFSKALGDGVENPQTYEKNKQLFWPMPKNSYRCLIPLYPSALTHDWYQKINGLRFSDENKRARENRRKKTAEQKPYVSISDIAVLIIGGANPQGVSRLMSRQRGRNYLMPSLPPVFESERNFYIGKEERSFFNKNLAYRCRKSLELFFETIEDGRNNMGVRGKRKYSMDEILYVVLSAAKYLQEKNSPGWTMEMRGLVYEEKLWLDPYRGDLEGEEEFLEDRDKREWEDKIVNSFGHWLNGLLKKKFDNRQYDFGDMEFKEWRDEMKEEIKKAQRGGMFL